MESLIPKGESLVTYYMLPLIGLNKLSFGRGFKASYLDKQGLKVYVELSRNMHTPLYKTNPNYITEIVYNNIKFIQFVMPTEFLNDSALFIVGQYSKMSLKAKKIIYTTSTLPYNSTMGSFTVSHPVLQALDRTKTLRKFLSDELGLRNISDSLELIDKPHDDWFIESKFKQ
mgnify:CR=1 FL=1